MMKKKQILTLLSLSLVVVLGLNSTTYKTTGSHPGSTGAPLDHTCAISGCHTDAVLIPNAVNNTTLSFSAADSSYVPGQTYTLTLKGKGTGSIPTTKFGFELVALNDKDSLNTGQFTISDPKICQLISHLQGIDNRLSVTHQAAGTTTVALSYTEWSFLWTAPPVNEGDISFYFAVNCTNDDGTEFGDRIYMSSFTIHPSKTTSIKELADEFDLTAHFNGEENSIVIRYDLQGKRKVQIRLFDSAGKQVYTQASETLQNKQEQKISLGSNFSKGTYILQLNIDEQVLTKKVIVQ